jgi:hypothetical protein
MLLSAIFQHLRAKMLYFPLIIPCSITEPCGHDKAEKLMKVAYNKHGISGYNPPYLVIQLVYM